MSWNQFCLCDENIWFLLFSTSFIDFFFRIIISLNWSISGLILIKAAIIKGLIIGGLIGAAASRGRGGGREGGRGRGGHGRGKRSIDEAAVEPILAVASQRDVDDCGKKLICRWNIFNHLGSGIMGSFWFWLQ